MPKPPDDHGMCESSSVSSASSAALATQVSTAVASKALDADKQQGAELVKMISSAKAIEQMNAQNVSRQSETAVDIYG